MRLRSGSSQSQRKRRAKTMDNSDYREAPSLYMRYTALKEQHMRLVHNLQTIFTQTPHRGPMSLYDIAAESGVDFSIEG